MKKDSRSGLCVAAWGNYCGSEMGAKRDPKISPPRSRQRGRKPFTSRPSELKSTNE